MKYLTLAIVSFICLGWQTGVISSMCYPPYVHACLKNKIHCGDVGSCFMRTTSCWNTNECIKKERWCEGPLKTMQYCAELGNCTDKFEFKENVRQICSVYDRPVMGSATSARAGFAASALLLVSYYFRE